MVIRPYENMGGNGNQRESYVHIVYNIRKFSEKKSMDSITKIFPFTNDAQVLNQRYGTSDPTIHPEVWIDPYGSGWGFDPITQKYYFDSTNVQSTYTYYDSIAVIEHVFPANYSTFPVSGKHGRQIGTAVHDSPAIPVFYDYDTLLTKYGIPAINASSDNNYYAWNCKVNGISVARRSTEIAPANVWIEYSQKSNIFIDMYNTNVAQAYHPCLNTYSNISDEDNDCSLIWEESSNGRYKDISTEIFYTGFKWCDLSGHIIFQIPPKPTTWHQDSSWIWYEQAEYVANDNAICLTDIDKRNGWNHLPEVYRHVDFYLPPYTNHNDGMRPRRLRHESVYWQGFHPHHLLEQVIFTKFLGIWTTDEDPTVVCTGYEPTSWHIEGHSCLLSPGHHLSHPNAVQGSLKKGGDNPEWYSRFHNHNEDLSADSVVVLNFVEQVADTFNGMIPAVDDASEIWQIHHSTHDLIYRNNRSDFSGADYAFRVGQKGSHSQLAAFPYINNNQTWDILHRIVQGQYTDTFDECRNSILFSNDYLLYKKIFDESANYFFFGYTDSNNIVTAITPIYFESKGVQEKILPEIHALHELENDTLYSKWIDISNYQEIALLTMGNSKDNVKLLVQRKKDMKLFNIPFVDDKGEYKCNAYNIGLINGKNKMYRFVWIPKENTQYDAIHCLRMPTIDKIDGKAKVSGAYIGQNSFIIDLDNDVISTDIKNTGLRVYPNPTSSEANLFYELDKHSKIKITLINNLGEEVLTICEGELGKGKYQFKINTFDFPSGMYTIRVVENDGMKFETLIIEK